MSDALTEGQGAATSDRQDAAAGEREVELHGHVVGYRAAGSGPPLVLVHGTPQRRMPGASGSRARPSATRSSPPTSSATAAIPVEHGRRAHRIVPDCRYVEIAGAGYWPMLDDPDRVAREITDFIDNSVPYEFSLGSVRDRIRRGPG